MSDQHLCDQCHAKYTYTRIGPRWLCKVCRVGVPQPSYMGLVDEDGREFGNLYFFGSPEQFWERLKPILTAAGIEHFSLNVRPLPTNMSEECEQCGRHIDPPTYDGLCGDCRCPQ